MGQAMEPIIPAIDRQLIEAELTSDRLFRETNAGSNLIYIVNHFNAPNVVREIGRLREVTFRDAGGGTGLAVDLDEYDTSENPFEQLIVWNPRDKEIIGGYRYIHGKSLTRDEDGEFHTPTLKLFKYSDKFVEHYLSHTLELGRSFVQPAYQPMNNIRKGMYSLDNIWDGLGALVHIYPDIKYFFGKITMYPSYNREARDLILYFMQKYFGDPDRLVYPIVPIELDTDEKLLEQAFPNGAYDKDYRLLIQKVRSLGENIPPLVNAYMNLSSTMKYFGTAINEGFGEVEESGIIVTIADIYEIKLERHISLTKKPS